MLVVDAIAEPEDAFNKMRRKSTSHFQKGFCLDFSGIDSSSSCYAAEFPSHLIKCIFHRRETQEKPNPPWTQSGGP
jgi:hypothetical protein